MFFLNVMVVLLVMVPGCKRFTLYIMSACSDGLTLFFISHLDFMVLFSFSAPFLSIASA
jgi:hypothetical protein